MLETLSLAERARHLRSPEGATGLAVADALAGPNREGNLRAVKGLGVSRGDRVLEVGCGTGSLAKDVVDQASDVTYIGLDGSPTVIQAARARNAALIADGSASFHQAFAEKMPFEDASFAKVFSIGVIHFWPDPLRGLAEVRRVMRPGALMLMGCLGPERAPLFAREDYGFHLREGQVWQSACQAAGFGTIDVQTSALGSDTGPELIQITARR